MDKEACAYTVSSHYNDYYYYIILWSNVHNVISKSGFDTDSANIQQKYKQPLNLWFPTIFSAYPT